MMAPHSAIANYYLAQAGGGAGHFYAGSPYQKGYGIGSWLGGLFRTIFPIFKSGALAVGREAARAGSHVLADVAVGENVRNSVQKHAEESAVNLATALKNKAESAMRGSGAINRRKRRGGVHSTTRGRAKRSYSDVFA